MYDVYGIYASGNLARFADRNGNESNFKRRNSSATALIMSGTINPHYYVFFFPGSLIIKRVNSSDEDGKFDFIL